VVEHFGDGSKFGIDIKYSIGTVEDETGTRLKNAEHLLQGEFLLMYSDNYCPIPLADIFDFYKKMGVPALMSFYSNKDGGGEYGYQNNVKISSEGFVKEFLDKTSFNPHLHGIDIGVFILSKTLINRMPKGNFSLQHGFLPDLIKTNELAGYRTDRIYLSITNPELVKKVERFLSYKKIIFLDRDGVINKNPAEHDYVRNWEGFEFLPGAKEAIKLLTRNNYQVYIVTNQRGVAQGLMSEDDLKDIHNRMSEELRKEGGIINDIYYCPHNHNECHCRKPQPGMLLRAARKYHIDLSRAVMIGDRQTDVEAGEAVGCRSLLIRPGEALLDKVIELLK